MKILFVGNYDMAGRYLASRLYREGNRICWLTGENRKMLWEDPIQGKVYRQAITYRTCRQILQGEAVDCILFLTGEYREAYLDGEGEKYPLLSVLSPVLRAAVSFKLQHICFLSSEILIREELLNPVFEELRAGERILSSFCRKYEIPLLILRLGCLFGEGTPEEAGYAGQILSSMRTERNVFCPYEPEAQFDFVCGSDMADAVYRLLNLHASGTYDLLTGYPVSARKLYSMAAAASGYKGKIEFGNRAHDCEKERAQRLKRTCGWMPFYLFTTMGVVYLRGNWKEEEETEEQEKEKRRKRWKERYPLLYETAQNLLLFGVSWMIANYSADWSDLRFVDVRLFYVILVAISFGMRQGLLATGLAIVSYTVDLLRSGIDISYLVYSVDSWIPFIVYGVAGAFAGYWSDKKNDEYDGLMNEFTEQQERYQFLKGLYREVVDVKNHLQKQIMISKDSISQLYTITEELGSTSPRVIYSRTVRVIEEVMECRSVAIYLRPRGEGGFARLVACSAGMARTLAPSIDLKASPGIFEAMEKRTMFVNRELSADAPAFAMPVCDGGRAIALIVLYELSPDQYTVYYKNMFQTLVQIVQNNLVRAYEYQEQNGFRFFIPETGILKAEAFEQEMEALRSMGEESETAFCIGRIVPQGKESLPELYRKIRPLLRGTDILGQGRDGAVRAVFLYAGKNSRPLLENRFANSGLSIVWEDGEAWNW